MTDKPEPTWAETLAAAWPQQRDDMDRLIADFEDRARSHRHLEHAAVAGAYEYCARALIELFMKPLLFDARMVANMKREAERLLKTRDDG